MFLSQLVITKDSFVSDIVRQDYRTARVFRNYAIDYCCGGKWAIGTVCELKGIEFSSVKKDLDHAIRPIQLSHLVRYDSWDIDFLVDYIINIHHSYLRQSLPEVKKIVKEFASEHADDHAGLAQIYQEVELLCKDMIPHLDEEEKIIFPYIQQIYHAYESKEPYAGLLVRTLRKPVENLMRHEHDNVSKRLASLRLLTNNYTPPANACASHNVVFSLLKELDSDLSQHVYLENEILFPRAIAMEKELLAKDR